jgi:DNA-binding response OmpR family regulator
VNAEPYTLVLVVEPHDETLADMLQALRGAGFAAVGVRTFEHAREQLTIDPPLALVTQARLGSYNGLHLAHVARQRRSASHVVILADLPDASLEREALQAGAAVMARPLPPATLPKVLAMLLGRPTRIAATEGGHRYERRHTERRQLVTPGYTPERRVADRRRQAWGAAT